MLYKITIILLITLQVSCITIPELKDKEYDIKYQGDGSFSDRGVNMVKDRFRVDFGRIDLHNPSTQKFKFSGLPSRLLIMEIELDEEFQHEYSNIYRFENSDRSKEQARLKQSVPGSHAKLNILLNKSGNENIFDVQGVIGGCEWSGKNGEIPIKVFMLTYKGECELVFNTHKQDEYRWPIVIPKSTQEYELVVRVVEADKSPSWAKIVFTGGGWKAP